MAVVALLAAGCTDEEAPATATAQTTGPAVTDSAAGIAEAQKIIDQYRNPPAWQGPNDPVQIGSLAGKKVTYISVSNSIPVLKYWSDKLTGLLQQYGGVQMTVIDAKGSVDEANKGFEQAIAQKADAIVFQALPPALFQAQITKAKAAGIKVISANTGVPGKVDGGQDAEIGFDYVKVGQLIGDWMVVDSQGKGKGLVVSSDDVPASQPQAQATLGEVKRLCPDCDVSMKDVQIPQWQTSVPTLFQTTINSDPDRKYLLPLYDGQALPGLGAIRTAGAGSKVTVGAFNATPGIVEQLKDPASGLKLDIGGHNEWWAYAAADQIFRVLSGAAPIANYQIGLRIFDTSNAELIQGSDEFAWYGASDYKTKFPALWTK
ncbi:sugar ABC transporter substrate-binding protein [Asanoa hainanensis]|uniref:sugar ABC transporter substrate-binding protein n=1 Tax=Asanoa hainanensis TaxID=560556 RepID=UPI0015C68A26|nr:substrate-binding domain-containing protein [Asanoa hainanensis]